ncbi:hypothetical protein E2562_006729 [Oryza meyeriana var. granulata]|uniref:SHSP domain-containing protein n=1 Tax=Oryza meyeriana var. granulata TaxID=110450 RepID=A0A6G1EGG4_9ORYZ|nr:hypothetical protein E2562_006729 [Oryza meyeriana var. granulata]
MDTRGIGRTFEEYNAAFEWIRGAEADAVKISLPGKSPSFSWEEIRVLVDNHGHLRTRGERPVGGNRWSLFQKDFQLPADCNVDGIRAKFENETLTITLPKKNPSPVKPSVQSPSPVQPEPPRGPPVQSPQRPPPALPGVPKPPSPPRRTPAPPPVLPLAPSQRLPRKPPVSEPAAATPPVPAPAAEPVTRKKSDLGTLMKQEEKVEEATKPLTPAVAAADEEEKKRMEMKMRGKMEEDGKMLDEKEKEKKKKANDAAAEGMPDMAQLSKPVSASRRQLVNVAVAVVVLLGITLYVWNTLRNATTGDDHGHSHGGASYSDEM